MTRRVNVIGIIIPVIQGFVKILVITMTPMPNVKVSSLDANQMVYPVYPQDSIVQI